jgi:hypothetical protein
VRTRAQEFDVLPTRTVREEFYSVYAEQVKVVKRQEAIAKELESTGGRLVSVGRLVGLVCSLVGWSVGWVGGVASTWQLALAARVCRITGRHSCAACTAALWP